MKHHFIRAAALAVCLSLCAASLSGCMAPFALANSISRDIGSVVDNTTSGLVDDVVEGLPTVEETIRSKDNANDHRRTETLADEGHVKLVLNCENVSQLILRQEGDQFQFEYDPDHFTVEPAFEDRRLFLTVTRSGDAAAKGEPNYKCILTIPDRAFEALQIEARRSAVAFSGITSPLSIQGESAGLAISNPGADLDIKNDDGAFAADISPDFAHRFTYSAENAAFSLRFPDGEPEGLRFKMECGKDSIVVRPTQWGGTMTSAFEYGAGDKAVFDFAVKNAAGVISVSQEAAQ